MTAISGTFQIGMRQALKIRAGYPTQEGAGDWGGGTSHKRRGDARRKWRKEPPTDTNKCRGTREGCRDVA